MRPTWRLATGTIGFAVLGIMGVLLSVAPAGVGPESLPAPAFLTIVVFVWMVRMPGASPLWMIFALGLFQDALSGGVLGAGVVPLLAMAMLMRRTVTQADAIGFIPRFLLFGVFAGGVALGQWAMIGLARLSMPGLSAVLVQYMLTLAIFPVIAAFFRRVLRLGT